MIGERSENILSHFTVSFLFLFLQAPLGNLSWSLSSELHKPGSTSLLWRGVAHLGHAISMSKVYCESGLYTSVLSPSCFPFWLSLFRHREEREKNYFINIAKYNLTSCSTSSPQPLFLFHSFLLSFHGFVPMGVHPLRHGECSIFLAVSILGDVTVNPQLPRINCIHILPIILWFWILYLPPLLRCKVPEGRNGILFFFLLLLFIDT